MKCQYLFLNFIIYGKSKRCYKRPQMNEETTSGKKRYVHFRLPTEMADAIDIVAKNEDITVSQVLRRAVRAYLTQSPKTQVSGVAAPAPQT
jgi:hypothetical protein